MKIKDKSISQMVSVSDSGCPKRACYWPRPDPGIFTQGQGYRSRGTGKQEWLCGTREARGCPSGGVCETCRVHVLPGVTNCPRCRTEIHPPIP